MPASTKSHLLLTSCSLAGCCQPFSESYRGHSFAVTSMPSTKPSDALVPIVVQELYKTAFHLPKAMGRLASEVYSHFFVQKKKPMWNIQQTVVMAFLQVFRDHTMTHSLEFHRLMAVAPSMLTPITAKTQDGSFRIRRRKLRGVLKECDDAEDGNRMLHAEWLSAGTVWDRCQSIIAKGTDSKGNQDILLEDGVEYTQTQPQRQSNALVLRTRSPEKIVLYIHGGAYCSMSAKTHRALTHKISKATGRRIFAFDYRLAPETKFPGGLYDSVQAFLYLIDADNGYSLDPKNIIFMGDSAGGGLCLATMLYLRDHGLPQPEGAVLLSPWVDLTFSYPSWDNASLYDYLPNNPDRIPSKNPAVLYIGEEKAAQMVRHPYVSPIFAESFENLAPLLIQSGGCESLRDEINDLVNKIGSTKTTLVHHEEYEDMVHVFQAFPFGKSAEAMESIGWWAKLGMPMLQQMQGRGQIPGAMQPETGPFAVKGTPRSMGRRFHSIPC